MSLPSVLIVGIDREIGSALFKYSTLKDDFAVYGTTRRRNRLKDGPNRLHLNLARKDPTMHAVLCAVGYNIRGLLRMIHRKGISLFVGPPDAGIGNMSPS